MPRTAHVTPGGVIFLCAIEVMCDYGFFRNARLRSFQACHWRDGKEDTGQNFGT